MKRITDIDKFEISFLVNIANKKRVIISEFPACLFRDNANKNRFIREEFHSFFSFLMRMKKELLFESLFLFSLRQYKQKERDCCKVSLRFLYNNPNKKGALTDDVLKVVSSSISMPMRGLASIKTPVKIPPLWRVGKVDDRDFLSKICFSYYNIYYNKKNESSAQQKSCKNCFILFSLVLRNRTIKLRQQKSCKNPLYNLDVNYVMLMQIGEGRFNPLGNNINTIYLFAYYNEMSNRISNKMDAMRAIIDIITNKLWDSACKNKIPYIMHKGEKKIANKNNREYE